MIGQTISHYKIVEKLGEGGMGVVYKAEDTKLGRTVALKFLAAHLLQDEESRARFIREAKAAAALDHPNICTVYEIDEAAGHTFIAMAFIEGETLQQKIEAGPLKIDDSLDIAIQVARGLAAAHHKGVVHRDIKSANVMIAAASPGADPQAKLLDFGLAQLATGSRLTEEGTTLGTVAYMSPEQAQGSEVDQRSDIWSLGVVLYEMISGRLAFQSEYEQGILYAALNEQPEPLTALRTGVPKELERIVGKCLAKEPGSRYQHVDEMLVDLRELQKERQSGESRLPAGGAPARAIPASAIDDKPASRTGWYVAASAVVVALSVAGAAWLGVFEPASQPPQEPMQVVPLTTYPGSEGEPSFSPDGTQLAFFWNGENQDNPDIYVKGIDSDTPQRLTSSPAFEGYPAWSPDGRQIAFLRRESSSGKFAVVLIPAIGGPEREVAEIGPFPLGGFLPPHYHAWLPDGNGLVVADRSSSEEPFALFLLSTETGGKRRLTSPPAESIGDSGPAFSPDGRTLAFVRTARYVVADIYGLSLSGDLTPQEDPQRLTFENGPIQSPVWMPDGRRIVFSRGFDAPGLWRVSVSGSGRPEPLAVSGQFPMSPAISQQGARLAYSSLAYDVNIWRMQVPDVESSPSSPTQFLPSTRWESQPQYSPDGKRIVFVSDRTGDFGIWISDSDGSNPAPLYLQEGALSVPPHWSPDGGRIAFGSNPEGHQDIYVISTSGGKPLRLTTDPADDMMPSWSRDGQWVYFGSRRGGRWEIWKISAAGGEAVQLTRNGGFVALESVDGRFVYYTKQFRPTTSLWRVPVDGGEESRVLESVTWWNFVVAEQGIYFIPALNADDPGGGYSLQFLDFARDKVNTVVPLPTPRYRIWFGLAVSRTKAPSCTPKSMTPAAT